MKVAIAGYGVMGRNHERVLRRLGHEVVTIDPKGHADYEDVHLSPRCDAAVIATPPKWLVSTARAFRDMPLLVEKPGAVSPQDLRFLPDHTWIGYTERWNPAFAALLRCLGDVESVRVERLGPISRTETPVALDLATHDLDLLEAMGQNRTPVAARVSDHHLSALLECGTIEASHLHPVKRRRIVVTGKPHIEADLYLQTLTVDGEWVEIQRVEPLAQQLTWWLAGAEAPVSPRSAAETLRIARDLDDHWRNECLRQPPALTATR